jgi:hypothetical protein
MRPLAREGLDQRSPAEPALHCDTGDLRREWRSCEATRRREGIGDDVSDVDGSDGVRLGVFSQDTLDRVQNYWLQR